MRVSIPSPCFPQSGARVFDYSKADFVHKLAIAQKECNETLYWLELLKATDYIDEKLFNSLYADAEEIMRMLTASIITVKKRLKK